MPCETGRCPLFRLQTTLATSTTRAQMQLTETLHEIVRNSSLYRLATRGLH